VLFFVLFYICEEFITSVQSLYSFNLSEIAKTYTILQSTFIHLKKNNSRAIYRVHLRCLDKFKERILHNKSKITKFILRASGNDRRFVSTEILRSTINTLNMHVITYN